MQKACSILTMFFILSSGTTSSNYEVQYCLNIAQHVTETSFMDVLQSPRRNKGRKHRILALCRHPIQIVA